MKKKLEKLITILRKRESELKSQRRTRETVHRLEELRLILPMLEDLLKPKEKKVKKKKNQKSERNIFKEWHDVIMNIKM